MYSETKFQFDPTNDIDFPYRTPLLKLPFFIAKVSDLYNGGLWEYCSIFVGSGWNFVSEYIKDVDEYRVSLGLKKQRIKKVIAKNPLTNFYEMNSMSQVACTRGDPELRRFLL